MVRSMIPATAAKMKISAPASPNVRVMGSPSIVSLVPDLLPVESQVFQDTANVVHHRAQAAQINVDVSPPFDGFLQVRLDAARAVLPIGRGTRESRPEAELRKPGCHRFEFSSVQ